MISEKPRLAVVKKTCVPGEAPESEDMLQGLCVACENHRNCKLTRPASGVWMCEEYC